MFRKNAEDIDTIFTILKRSKENQDSNNEHVEKKLDLILEHLNLEYIPESETKEEAKLVGKKEIELPEGFGGLVLESASGVNTVNWNDCDFDEVDIKPKKKRKYTKKKK